MDQHVDQRSLDGLIQACHALGRQTRFQKFVQAQSDVGVLGGVVQSLVQGHLIKADFVFARAGDVLEFYIFASQVKLVQLVHAVTVQTAVEHVGQHHGVVHRCDGDAVSGEHLHVVLDVLPLIREPPIVYNLPALHDRIRMVLR